MNIYTALKRPFTNISTLLLGAIILPFFILNFFVYGYLAECARTAYKKRYELPKFKSSMFLDGLYFWLVAFFYFIPVTLLFYLLLIFEAEPNSILTYAIIALGILTTYLLPAGLIKYSITKNFFKSFKGVFSMAFRIKYLIALIQGFFCMFIIYITSFLLVFYILPMIFPSILYFILGMLISAISLFAGLIAFITILSKTFKS